MDNLYTNTHKMIEHILDSKTIQIAFGIQLWLHSQTVPSTHLSANCLIPMQHSPID